MISSSLACSSAEAESDDDSTVSCGVDSEVDWLISFSLSASAFSIDKGANKGGNAWRAVSAVGSKASSESLDSTASSSVGVLTSEAVAWGTSSTPSVEASSSLEVASKVGASVRRETFEFGIGSL